MRMSLRLFIIACSAILGLAAVVVVIEVLKTSELRRRFSVAVVQKDTLESRKQRYENLARAEPTSQDQEALQQEIKNLQVLRSTQDALRAKIEQSLKKTLARKTGPASSELQSIPWKRMGRATPAATIETVFWSMAQGDRDTLATLIAFDDDAQDQAERFYDVLPEDLREEYDGPERLVAALMAIEKPVALTSVNVLGETFPGRDRSALQLAAPSGQISLNFRRDAGGWKLLVPALVVDGYRHYAIGTLSLSKPAPDI